ncbi:MAG: sialate O-acetylesterase, partial [Verrucomicrobia bacterium]|nr:sialate O-acetylesterase [Verrucomicrobiota bacterium]
MLTLAVSLATFLPSAQVIAADFKLSAIFSDHMVLQREKPVAVWGWADAGESVTVAFGGQSKSAT